MDTETIKRKINENKMVAIATGVIILIIIGLLFKSFGTKGPVPGEGPITVTGEFACLPYVGEAPDEEKCELGVKEAGNYYGIDVSTISLAVTDLKANDKIIVTGNFLPIAQVSSEEWKKYNIAGLINVEALTRGK